MMKDAFMFKQVDLAMTRLEAVRIEFQAQLAGAKTAKFEDAVSFWCEQVAWMDTQLYILGTRREALR